MALSIKSDEADRLARELAARTGESLTQAIVVALRERLSRENARRLPIESRLRRLQAEVAAMPIRDDRAADEVLGYDVNGLPR